MSFTSVTVRENGQKVLYSWFNALRTAGIAADSAITALSASVTSLFSSYFGAGRIGETSITCTNNQSATDVTGLSISAASYRSGLVQVEVNRKTDSNEAVSVGFLKLIYKAATSTWELIDELGGDEDGVTFTITAAGQVQYASDNMAGTNYVGKIKFRLSTFTHS